MLYVNIRTQQGPIGQSQLPTQDGTTFNISWGMQMNLGWRKIENITPVPEGYILLSRTFAQSETDAEFAVDSITTISVEESEAQRQAAKSVNLKTAENNFYVLCQTLGFPASAKPGFDELNVVLEQMQITMPQEAVVLSVKLLAVDAAAKREGGLRWWDDCIWHPEIVG